MPAPFLFSQTNYERFLAPRFLVAFFALFFAAFFFPFFAAIGLLSVRRFISRPTPPVGRRDGFVARTRRRRYTRSMIKRAKSGQVKLVLEIVDGGGDSTRGAGGDRRSRNTDRIHATPQLNHRHPYGAVLANI